MGRIGSAVIVCCVALQLVAGQAPSHAQSYRIVDLGTLGGHASGGDGLNELGETVGWSIVESGAYYGFLSNIPGTNLTNLGPAPNGTYTYAQDANDSGQVVGFGEVQVGFGKDDHAFLWENGQMSDLGTLGGDASQAWGINAGGQVVGWAEDGGPGYYAFLWEDGVMTELPGFEGGYPDSAASDINDAGVAVGHSWDANSVRQAVVWEDGVLTRTLELSPDVTGAKAYAINDLGEVTGNGWGGGGVTTAILWAADGSATLLPPTASHYYNVAYDVNDSAQVVGMSYSGGHGGSSGGPVLWEQGIAFELEDIVAPLPGIYGFTASAINDAGQIAATGSASGGFRALRLDPIPGGLGLSGPDPGRRGEENQLAVRGGTPGARMIFVAGFDFGSTDVPGCPGTFVSIGTPVLAGVVRVDENGHAILRREVPESARGRTGRFQAVELGSCRVTNVTQHTFF